MDFLELDPLLKAALREDLGRGDLTTEAILPDSGRRASARIVAKEELVLAGWPVFLRVFELLGDIEGKAYFLEGEKVGCTDIGRISGPAGALLKGERVALNFLQRLCGIATRTRELVELVSHTQARILDTRKTTPLLRNLEKYAVRIGGGYNHRFGLDDGILIKENHIALAGGLGQAYRACREKAPHLNRIEVEVENHDQLEEALLLGAEVVLLDNMTPDQVREAVALSQGRCLLEVSGGVNEGNIAAYAEAGVDLISLGALTHSSRAADISMLME
jgi:nicotinate-nucleotide pyrophosphorylase (carboxylating)